MKTPLKLNYLMLMALIFIKMSGFAQSAYDVDIRFLNAAFTDTTKGRSLVAIFLISTPDSTSFPPIVHIPPKCTVFEDGREKVVLLMPQNFAAAMDDKKIAETNPKTYALIKDKIDLKSLKSFMIITYTLKDLNYNFHKMSLTPSFSPKIDQTIRVQKRAEFELK